MNWKMPLPAIRILLCVIIFVSLVAYMFICAPNQEWHGFGIDSQEKVYIGKQNEINVYYCGEQIGTIPILPFRTYYFTVQQNDTILLSSSLNVYVFDLEGNQLSCEPDVHNRVYDELRHLKVAETGNNIYNLQTDILGNYTVTGTNGTVLFSESESLRFIDLLIPHILLLSTIALLLSFAVALPLIRQK